MRASLPLWSQHLLRSLTDPLDVDLHSRCGTQIFFAVCSESGSFRHRCGLRIAVDPAEAERSVNRLWAYVILRPVDVL
jgi:hypothetical protein